MRGTGGKQTRILEPAPLPPNCLLKDDLGLPDRYVPPEWATTLLEEWRKADELRAVGAYPTQSALISGPSGVGKTTASRWLAKQLKLPVYSLSLSSAIESYMGATGTNLDRAIRFGVSVPQVLVMDELDSVAANRSAKGNDVGEIWRITNTLIQALDLWHSAERKSFLMATTNMPESVDGAIRRRFEIEVQVVLPSNRELSEIAGVPLPASFQCSHATLRRMVLQAKRESVMRRVDYALTLLAMVANINPFETEGVIL